MKKSSHKIKKIPLLLQIPDITPHCIFQWNLRSWFTEKQIMKNRIKQNAKEVRLLFINLCYSIFWKYLLAQVISRLGISVLPPLHPTSPSPILRNGRNLSSPLFTSSRPSSPLSSPLNFRKSSSLSEHLKCSDHFYNVDSYCYSCNKQLCKECLLDAHMLHHTGTWC